MRLDTSYHRYTELDKEPGGLRRLDLIANAIESYQRTTDKRSPRVLDVGCGNGHISIPLASLGDLWQAPIYLFVSLVIGYLALHFKEVAR